MLTIVLGFVLAVICILLGGRPTENKQWQIGTYSVVGACIMLVAIFISGIPLYGYEEPLLDSETKLVSIGDDQKQIYVYEFANDVWLYKYVKTGEDATLEEERGINIVRENVKVTELDSCTTPMLKKYVVKSKSGLFSVGGADKTYYEFIVPTGTLEKTNFILN